jgi:formylglycine-generating enzyme required for sulfatase activity
VQPRERYATAAEFWAALAGALPPSMPADDGFWASMLEGGSTDPLAPTAPFPGTGRPRTPSGARPGNASGPAGYAAGGAGYASGQAGYVSGQAGGAGPGPGNTGRGSMTGGAGLAAARSMPGVEGAGSSRKSLALALGATLAVAGLGAGVWFLRGAVGQGDAGATRGELGASSAAMGATAGSAAMAAGSAASGPLGCPPEMALIAGGTFSMGASQADAEAESNERPPHDVTLSPYCIDRHEVSVDDYQGCVSIGSCEAPPAGVEWEGITARERKIFSPLCNGNDKQRGQHPVNCVDWTMAEAYCSFHSKRLPTEAEWELAARGPQGRSFPWGNEAPTSAHVNGCGVECARWLKANGEPTSATLYAVDDGFPATAPVGSHPKGRSPEGVDDLAGNVWEWTADFSGAYTSAAQTDPKGPADGTRKMLRGGGFNGEQAKWLRPTQRWSAPPARRSHAFGFRCAQQATPTSGGGGKR